MGVSITELGFFSLKGYRGSQTLFPIYWKKSLIPLNSGQSDFFTQMLFISSSQNKEMVISLRTINYLHLKDHKLFKLSN